jgi:uncharacterized protein (DUF1697 family)
MLSTDPMAVVRYAAFLRGVSPMNLQMSALGRCLEAAGMSRVKTVRSSGNVVFDARAASEASLERKLEKAMDQALGRSFLTFVRSVDSLQALLAADPFSKYRLAAGSKRIVTFLRNPPEAAPTLPIAADGARILCMAGREAFMAYVPGPKSAAFMALIEKTLGKEVTTRTWDTVQKVANA